MMTRKNCSQKNIKGQRTCSFLVSQRVNSEIWSKVKSTTRNINFKLATLGEKMIKTQIGLTKLIAGLNDLKEDTIRHNVIKKITKEAVDGYAPQFPTAVQNGGRT